MDVVTHGLVGALVVRAVRSRTSWPVVAAAVGGALAPDLDGVAGLWDPMAAITVHRTMTHSLVGGLPLAAGVAAVTKPWGQAPSFPALAGLAYLGVQSGGGVCDFGYFRPTRPTISLRLARDSSLSANRTWSASCPSSWLL